MHVHIGESEVVKTFKVMPGYKARYKREKLALLRLKWLHGFPKITKCDDALAIIVMSRLAGDKKEHLSDENLNRIRWLVEEMLNAGVSRHTLPVRDFLISSDDSVSMVDFERVTIRYMSWSPIWLAAKYVTKLNLLRLISNHNPAILSKKENKQLVLFVTVRENLQGLKRLRDKIRSFVA